MWDNVAPGLRALLHAVTFVLFCGSLIMAVLGGICHFSLDANVRYCVGLGWQGSLGIFIAGIILFGLLVVYCFFLCWCMSNEN